MRRRGLGALGVLVLACLVAATVAVAQVRSNGGGRLQATDAAGSCQLNFPHGNIKHIIYIQFDNTHFRRDNPNVPSDLEQMPHLLNFINGNGRLLANDHTALISHTAIDIPTVFGAGSPEAAEVATNPGQAFADFVGIGIHCAQSSVVCSAANHGRPDLLPDEPGSYAGFNGLFGAKYVDPVIKPSGPMTDLNGNVIQDASGHVGFPGFDGMEATVSLSWVAQMQEAGVPVTYAYISDAHDGHGTSGNIHFAYGPGEAGYVQQLHDYDTAFQKFFERLAADGINKSNTLFVFTVDEGDHFVGDAPTPAGCDGGTP